MSPIGDLECGSKICRTRLHSLYYSFPVPCFVQVMNRDSQIYNGVGIGGGLRTNYEMIVLKKRPPYCDHLTGLLNLFKTKIKQDCASEIDLPSVKVSARFSYILEDWTSYGWSQPPPDMDMFSGRVGSKDFQFLDFKSLKFLACSV